MTADNKASPPAGFHQSPLVPLIQFMLHIIIVETRSKMDRGGGRLPVLRGKLAARERENVRVALILEIGLILLEMSSILN